MVRSVEVAVIGAGVAGLCAARELKREGHRVVVFEKANRIGGMWVYDPRSESDPLSRDPRREVIHSSLYLSLRSNLPRQLMGFLDYPFPERENGDPRTFPGHQEVLWFLEKFADDFGLLELIRFDTEVVRVKRVGERIDQWMVESVIGGCDSVSRETFEAVVVCTGHFTEPELADIQGIDNWPGRQIHSHNYRVPESFRGQIVVLIGFGPSAFDISRDIATEAKEVHIATRSPKVKVGKLDEHKNIWHHKMVERVFEDGRVSFLDGSSFYADTLFYCTGYKYHYPYLMINDIVTIEENCVGPLYKHVFPPALAPWLSFIGIPTKNTPFQTIELQSKWVASVLSSKIMLPNEEEMLTSTKKYYGQMEENGIPKQYTHVLRPNETEYSNSLFDTLGLPRLEEWRVKIYEESIKNIVAMQDGYRDQWDGTSWDALIKGNFLCSVKCKEYANAFVPPYASFDLELYLQSPPHLQLPLV